ncbi:MAG: hypothetical protein U0872_02115 [Planctomycetaceae bacterium]
MPGAIRELPAQQELDSPLIPDIVHGDVAGPVQSDEGRGRRVGIAVHGIELRPAAVFVLRIEQGLRRSLDFLWRGTSDRESP